MKPPRRSDREIIATFCGMDLAEMRDYRYQPTLWKSPAIYSMDLAKDGVTYAFLAAPAGSKIKPSYADMAWVKIGEEYGRSIFGSTGGAA